jgi:hypothetical protein
MLGQKNLLISKIKAELDKDYFNKRVLNEKIFIKIYYGSNLMWRIPHKHTNTSSSFY